MKVGAAKCGTARESREDGKKDGIVIVSATFFGSLGERRKGNGVGLPMYLPERESTDGGKRGRKFNAVVRG